MMSMVTLCVITDIVFAIDNTNGTSLRLINLVSTDTQREHIMPHLSWMEHCRIRLVCRLWNIIINDSYQLSLLRMHDWQRLWYLSWRQMHRIDGFYMHRFNAFFIQSKNRDKINAILLNLKRTMTIQNDREDTRMIGCLIEHHFDDSDPIRTLHAYTLINHIMDTLNITDQTIHNLYHHFVKKCYVILHSYI